LRIPALLKHAGDITGQPAPAAPSASPRPPPADPPRSAQGVHAPPHLCLTHSLPRMFRTLRIPALLKHAGDITGQPAPAAPSAPPSPPGRPRVAMVTLMQSLFGHAVVCRNADAAHYSFAPSTQCLHTAQPCAPGPARAQEGGAALRLKAARPVEHARDRVHLSVQTVTDIMADIQVPAAERAQSAPRAGRARGTGGRGSAGARARPPPRAPPAGRSRTRRRKSARTRLAARRPRPEPPQSTQRTSMCPAPGYKVFTLCNSKYACS